MDTNGDGIANTNDKCPSVAGFAKYNGRAVPDIDSDDVNNEMYSCQNVAGVAGNLGCPEMILYYKCAVAGLK